MSTPKRESPISEALAAVVRTLAGRHATRTVGRDTSQAMEDRSAAAVGYVRLYRAASKLVAAIDQADSREGVGDRTEGEHLALDELRRML